jgi:DNA (cytosine-5)-methyltransferase 1
MINNNRKSTRSMKNCSLLANTLSWVEVFMPAYVIIENVPTMDSGRPNACSQAICHLVALGYQVRRTFPRVEQLGGASLRERLIIIAAAPGVILPQPLPATHGNTSGLLPIRTSANTIADLPAISNEMVDNIQDPDHITLQRFKIDFPAKVNLRHLVQQIPTSPVGRNITNVYNDGGLDESQRKWFEGLDAFKRAPHSRMLQRINGAAPFRTVCTRIHPMDARFSGECLHPSQDRMLSVKEVRRAMDVPDWFLVVGSLAQQMDQLGNGVPWVLGAALGRAVGRA